MELGNCNLTPDGLIMLVNGPIYWGDSFCLPDLVGIWEPGSDDGRQGDGSPPWSGAVLRGCSSRPCGNGRDASGLRGLPIQIPGRGTEVTGIPEKLQKETTQWRSW